MKKVIEMIKTLRQDTKGRAILFFGFYVLFFSFVILFVRFGSRDHTASTDYETSDGFQMIDIAEMDNYQFRYLVTIDDSEVEYTGKKYQNQREFTYLNKKYYSNGEYYFVFNDVWDKINNPIYFKQFIEDKTYFRFMEVGYLESKTSYESGKMVYHYQIATDTLTKEINDMDTDIGDDLNEMILHMDDGKHLSRVVYQLDSYGIAMSYCKKSLKIELQFDQIGEVEEIKNPIL